MPHLSRFTAERYRRISGLTLDRIAPFNLITGRNGSGKSSLLEALWLFHGRGNPAHLWASAIQRTPQPVTNPIERLAGDEARLSGQENGAEHSMRASFTPTLQAAMGTSSVLNAACTIRDFGTLVESGEKENLIEDMGIIPPKIRDIAIAVIDNASHILATTEDGARIPIQALGGGAVRLFHALIAMRTARMGTVFLDEVENGLHYSALPPFWKGIRRLATELDVQVFASTHSDECLEAAISAFHESPDDLAVHHLYEKGGDIRASTYRGETLLGATEINLELR